MNLFFFLLVILLLFVDVNLYNKEISICKILGYNSGSILRTNIIKQLLISSLYYLTILLPLGLWIYDKSLDSLNFVISSLILITKMYIITNVLYLGAYMYTIYKTNIIQVLKGKKDSSTINSISYCTNILSKLIIIILLIILIVPTYQLLRVCNQYNLYIKKIENYVNYEIPEKLVNLGLENEAAAQKKMEQIYQKYNSQGAILKAISSKDYSDTEEYVTPNQIILVNYNYMKAINLADKLNETDNYLLIPKSMINSENEIVKEVEADYFTAEQYQLLYYDNEAIYTYDDMGFYNTGGYIYYSIILVSNNLMSNQGTYILDNLYYQDEAAPSSAIQLTESYYEFFHLQLKLFLTLLALIGILSTLVMLSSYYMMRSYIEINGKEIAYS